MGMTKKGEYIYIAYDRKDGLPIAVADSPQELGTLIGKDRNHVSKMICRGSELYKKVKNYEEV